MSKFLNDNNVSLEMIKQSLRSMGLFNSFSKWGIGIQPTDSQRLQINGTIKCTLPATQDNEVIIKSQMDDEIELLQSNISSIEENIRSNVLLLSGESVMRGNINCNIYNIDNINTYVEN